MPKLLTVSMCSKRTNKLPRSATSETPSPGHRKKFASQANVMGEIARNSQQEPSAHLRGNFAASSLNGSLSANCKRVMPADLVILATKFDTLRSILSSSVGKRRQQAADWTCSRRRVRNDERENGCENLLCHPTAVWLNSAPGPKSRRCQWSATSPMALRLSQRGTPPRS